MNNYKRLLLFFLVATLLGALLFGVLGNVIALLFLDINVFKSGFDISTLPEVDQINLFRLTQPFNTVGIFMFSPLAVKFFYKKSTPIKFAEHKFSYLSILIGSALIVVVKPVVSWLSIINNDIDFTFLGDFGESLLETSKLMAERIAIVAKSNSISELMLNIFIIALLPAIAEELFFRGFIQKLLTKVTNNYHLSVWITALVFGMIHLNILSLLPLVFLGVMLGYIYQYSQNIWTSILAHFINNASLLIFVYKYSFDLKNVASESVPIQSIILSVVLSFALLYFLYSIWDSNKSPAS